MQHGPGTENAYGGVAQACSESVPILVMPGATRAGSPGSSRNYNSSVQMRDITKSAEPVTSAKRDPRDLPPRVHAAALGSRRPGAGRGAESTSWNEEIDAVDYVPVAPLRSGPTRRPCAKPRRCCSKAKRPVLYAGQGVHWAEAWDELKAAGRAARHSRLHQPGRQ